MSYTARYTPYSRENAVGTLLISKRRNKDPLAMIVELRNLVTDSTIDSHCTMLVDAVHISVVNALSAVKSTLKLWKSREEPLQPSSPIKNQRLKVI